jgi:hypothetical protein
LIIKEIQNCYLIILQVLCQKEGNIFRNGSVGMDKITFRRVRAFDFRMKKE